MLIRTDDDAIGRWAQLEDSLLCCGMLDILKSPRVLDVGARMAVLVKWLIHRKIDAIGCETDSRFVDGKYVVYGDAEKLPFDDGAFNIILLNGVFCKIYYDNDYSKMFSEFHRVLTDGGIVFSGNYDGNWASGHLPTENEYENFFHMIQPKQFPRDPQTVPFFIKNC